jgi:hypothetical protein
VIKLTWLHVSVCAPAASSALRATVEKGMKSPVLEAARAGGRAVAVRVWQDAASGSDSDVGEDGALRFLPMVVQPQTPPPSPCAPATCPGGVGADCCVRGPFTSAYELHCNVYGVSRLTIRSQHLSSWQAVTQAVGASRRSRSSFVRCAAAS